MRGGSGGHNGGRGRASWGKMGRTTEIERISENGRMWRRVEVEEGKRKERSREEKEGRRGREYGLKSGKEREKGKQGYWERGRLRRGGEGRG